MAEPVFYDPRRARWKRLRRFVDALVAAVSALIIFFVYTTLRDERLPELLFSPQKRAFKALKESEKDKARDRQKKLAARSHRRSKVPASEVTLNQEEGIRAAFYVPWDAASFSSLRDDSRRPCSPPPIASKPSSWFERSSTGLSSIPTKSRSYSESSSSASAWVRTVLMKWMGSSN